VYARTTSTPIIVSPIRVCAAATTHPARPRLVVAAPDRAMFDPAMLDPAMLGRAMLDRAMLDRAMLDPAMLDPTGLVRAAPGPVRSPNSPALRAHRRTRARPPHHVQRGSQVKQFFCKHNVRSSMSDSIGVRPR
jgi:hypothetical protein